MRDKIIVYNCSIFTLNNQNINNELNKYIDYCKGYTKMYICEKKDDFIFYQISYDYKCPLQVSK